MRRMIVILLLAIAAGAIGWFAGPRADRDTSVTFEPASIGHDVEAYLAAEEAKIPRIREGLAKEIVWAYPASKAKTPLAIVYVHGFSASKGEIRPVPDKVAQVLGANLFFTRLAGHGRDGPAMAEATARAWVNDFAEAIAVGHAIGEKVIVIGVSTGGSVAAWAATQARFADEMAGLVLISPNFGVRAGSIDLMAGPWGLQIARLAVGSERGFQPRNALQEKYWTYRYPIEATMPMAAMVTLAAAAPFETVRVPALFILSDADQVVRPDITRTIEARWGAPHKLVAIEKSDDPSNHVIAGDAFSPSTTDLAVATIVEWVRALPK